MPDHAGKTLVYQLLGDVSKRRKATGEILESITSEKRKDSRIVTSVSHSSALPLVEFPFLGSDEIDRDLDMFTDQFLPQELSSLVGIESLLRIGLSRGRVKANRSHINKTQR